MKKESRGRDLKKRGAARKPGKVQVVQAPLGPGPGEPSARPWLERASAAGRTPGLLPIAARAALCEIVPSLRLVRLGQLQVYPLVVHPPGTRILGPSPP